MLTLDLVAEEDAASQDCGACWDEDLQVELQTEVLRSRQRADTDVSKLRVSSREPTVKTGSLPRGSERSWDRNLEVHKKHQVQVEETLPGSSSWTATTQTCSGSNCSSRFSRLSPEPLSPGRGPPPTPAAAAPPWMKSCPPGSLSSSLVLIQKVPGSLSSLRTLRLFQTRHDPLGAALGAAPLPHRGGGKGGGGAARGAAAEPDRSADAEGPGAAGGDAAAGGIFASAAQPAGSNAGSDPQELQKTRAEREPGASPPYLKTLDSPRLHHLRGSDSAHSRSVLEGTRGSVRWVVLMLLGSLLQQVLRIPQEPQQRLSSPPGQRLPPSEGQRVSSIQSQEEPVQGDRLPSVPLDRFSCH